LIKGSLLAASLDKDRPVRSPTARIGEARPENRQQRAMLRALSVQNLALIEDVHVELEGGYCAWTGETGAGKSLLLTALGLVLGGKASADLIRSGKSEARAAATFELNDSSLKAEIEAILGGPLDEEELILIRRVAAGGRGSAHVNGLPVTVGTLQKLGERLVDIHGQLEGRALLQPHEQRALLDAYGCLEEKVSTYRAARDAHEALRRKRQTLLETAEARQRQRALLEFERDELAAADPRAGEYDELTREAQRLACAEQIKAAAVAGYSLLYESDRSAQDLLTGVARTLESLTSSAPELAEAAGTLERLADETREVAFSLRDIAHGWDDDPARLEELEARMALYRRLAGRFHCTADDLASRRAAIDVSLGALERDEVDLLEMDLPLAGAWQAVQTAAAALSSARRKVCRHFERVVQEQLKPLGLGDARLTVAIETDELAGDPLTAIAPGSGVDHVEIQFSANPGEELRPLRKIASGGELSRLTLAVKTVLAAVDRVSTLVFDEIDAGVGGRLGSALGKALAELALYHQVICVTHLPQMASFADRQWVIRKHVERGRSRTTITPLDEPERIAELAAMLRGDSAAEGTLQEATSMLREARSEVKGRNSVRKKGR
jgi:DNA repair protein RecN (Recombination protein N)